MGEPGAKGHDNLNCKSCPMAFRVTSITSADALARRVLGLATAPCSGHRISSQLGYTLTRQPPTGLNFVASGMAYWSTDVGGIQFLPAEHQPLLVAGGQTITPAAPIDMPLFVRAGAIVPLGDPIEHTGQPQKTANLKLYRGANGSFRLYNDDAIAYRYEPGENSITTFLCNDSSKKLTLQGPAAWTGPAAGAVETIGRFNSPFRSHGAPAN